MMTDSTSSENTSSQHGDASSMINSVKSQLMDKRNWHRPITIIALFFVLSVFGGTLVGLYLIVALVQWLLTLALGEPNASLKAIMTKASHYVHQTMQYLAAENDDRPFPVSLLP